MSVGEKFSARVLHPYACIRRASYDSAHFRRQAEANEFRHLP